MTRLFILFVFTLVASEIKGQKNLISLDSLGKVLPGKWNGIIILCHSKDQDSISLKMILQDSSFLMTKMKGSKIFLEEKGKFTVDSIHHGDYTMTVLLDKKYPENPYNALYIGIKVIDRDNIQITMTEAVYHKGNLHTRHYTGEYGFSREYAPTSTR